MTENSELLKQLKLVITEENERQTNEIKAQLYKEIVEIKALLTRETDKITKLENRTDEINHKTKQLETFSKQNNIVIFNSEFDEGDILNFTLTLLNTHLELNLNEDHINNLFTIGKQENKPILVSFTSYLTKQKVLRSCSKLKGTDIRISEDLSKEERNVRKVLVKHLKAAKSDDKKAHIYRQKLFIEGKAYSVEDLTDKKNDEDTMIPEQEEGTQSKKGKLKGGQENRAQDSSSKKNNHPETITLRSASRNITSKK